MTNTEAAARNEINALAAELLEEIKAEMRTRGTHVLPNGLVKAFEVYGYDEDGRRFMVVSSGWGDKYVSELKRALVDRLRTRMGGLTAQIFNVKRRGFNVWCTYFSTGHHDGWAAGVKWDREPSSVAA